MGTTNVLLLADTHLRVGQADRLLERIEAELAAADIVVHAGDVTDASILDALRAAVRSGRVHAVRGNNDHDLDLPERSIVEVDGCIVAILHDAGAAAGRTARLRRWFPAADLVVFGHSHLPWHEVDIRAADGHGQHHVNPGSAILRRRAPTCTVASVVIDGGAVAEVRHVAVGTPPRRERTPD